MIWFQLLAANLVHMFVTYSENENYVDSATNWKTLLQKGRLNEGHINSC